MGRLFVLVLLALPFAEIAMFIWVGGLIGIVPTLLATILGALFGILMLRWQGLGILMQSRVLMAEGRVPARQMAEGMLLALAGFLLLVPGFLTDVMGLLLLIPPVRAAVFALLSRNMVVVSTHARPTGPEAPKSIDLGPDDYRS